MAAAAVAAMAGEAGTAVADGTVGAAVAAGRGKKLKLTVLCVKIDCLILDCLIVDSLILECLKCAGPPWQKGRTGLPWLRR